MTSLFQIDITHRRVLIYFYSIADYSEPRDRIVQVVRWFLSAFHAGRRSEVAKKPYNPILGETFRCWWDINKDKPATSETAVSDGPVPWCNVNQLTFVAEQVSHHPPGINPVHTFVIFPMVIPLLFRQFLHFTLNITAKGYPFAPIYGPSPSFSDFPSVFTILDKDAYLCWTMTKNTLSHSQMPTEGISCDNLF